MFAFAIWDVARRRLILARDRLGIKPLYYAVTDRELMFASEIKTLIARRPAATFSNATCCRSSSRAGMLPATRPSSRSSNASRPGASLTWSANEGIAIRRYWHLPAAGENGASMASAAATLRATAAPRR